jgi:hypothetical protein
VALICSTVVARCGVWLAAWRQPSSSRRRVTVCAASPLASTHPATHACSLCLLCCLSYPTPPQVPLMGLIELVRGMQTSDDTFEATQRLAAHLGKTTCVSLVSPCLPAHDSPPCPALPACQQI